MFVEVHNNHISIGSIVFPFNLSPEFVWFTFPEIILFYTLLPIILPILFCHSKTYSPVSFRVNHANAPHFYAIKPPQRF